MARARFSDPQGLTVKDLKAILSDLPEQDTDGDDAVVFVLAGNGHISPLTQVVVDDENSSIFVPEFHCATMEDLETYADFFGMEPEFRFAEDDDVEGVD